LLCIGNPARGDDGLGPAFGERFEAMGLSGVTVDSCYQLSVEDAVDVAEHDTTVFVDADASCAPPFRVVRVAPATEATFTTHFVSPGEVLGLAKQCFGASGEAWLVGVRGYVFEPFVLALSEGAKANLEEAVKAVAEMVRNRSFHQVGG